MSTVHSKQDFSHLLKEIDAAAKQGPGKATPEVAETLIRKIEAWQPTLQQREELARHLHKHRNDFTPAAAEEIERFTKVELSRPPRPGNLAAKHDVVEALEIAGKAIAHTAEKIFGGGHPAAAPVHTPPAPPGVSAAPPPPPPPLAHIGPAGTASPQMSTLTPQMSLPTIGITPIPIVPIVPVVPTQHKVTLAWTLSTSPNVTGQKIHFGTSSGNYTQTIPIGPGTVTYSITGLAPGNWYFAVTALDGSLESTYSNEAHVVVP